MLVIYGILCQEICRKYSYQVFVCINAVLLPIMNSNSTCNDICLFTIITLCNLYFIFIYDCILVTTRPYCKRVSMDQLHCLNTLK